MGQHKKKQKETALLSLQTKRAAVIISMIRREVDEDAFVACGVLIERESKTYNCKDGYVLDKKIGTGARSESYICSARVITDSTVGGTRKVSLKTVTHASHALPPHHHHEKG